MDVLNVSGDRLRNSQQERFVSSGEASEAFVPETAKGNAERS
jgi:hypothetical protein